MTLGMIWKISIKGLGLNKFRSFLTMLGIIIGVGAVIAMVSLGQGARRQVQEEIEAMGSNTLIIMSGSRSSWGTRGGTGSMNTLIPEDFEAIQSELPTVVAVSPSASTMAQVVFGNQNWNVRIEGCDESYPQLRNWKIESGSFFEEKHVKTSARVAVLGKTVVNELFGGVDPVGQKIRIKNLPFQVLGVLQAKGSNAWGRDQDDTIMVPYTTVQKKFLGGVQYVTSGVVGMIDSRVSYTTEAQIRDLLRQRHQLTPQQDDDFRIRNMSEMAEAAESTNAIMTALLASIAAVSLLVGGIGIMNIMLVAVSERTREIGIRMAIGARPSHVRIQFLSESVALCLLGGLLGLAAGIGGSVLISQLLGWPTQVSVNSILISIIFSAGIGIFFGYYPAHKAAGLDPIEALHYE